MSAIKPFRVIFRSTIARTIMFAMYIKLASSCFGFLGYSIVAAIAKTKIVIMIANTRTEATPLMIRFASILWISA